MTQDCWSQMPLDAPLQIRSQERLFMLGIVLYKIGGKGSWQGNINKLVELANAKTPLRLPRWTYAKVDYALRWLRKEGWLRAERPARNKPLVYYKSHPDDLLQFEEKIDPVEITLVEPIVIELQPVQKHRPKTLYELQRDEDAIKRMEEFDAIIGIK